MICDNCGAAVGSDSKFCDSCGKALEVRRPRMPKLELTREVEAHVETRLPNRQLQRRTEKVISRYRDAYRVARTLVGIGIFIQVIGAVLGVVAGIVVSQVLGPSAARGIYQPDLRTLGQYQLIASIVVCGIIMIVFWIIGVVVSSRGQVLKANLDTAVNTSPFLSNEQRAAIMSLPLGAPVAGGTKKCPDCAESIKLEALVCQHCGHKFEHAEVQVAIQHAKSEIGGRELTAEEKDRLSRSLCPSCGAYNAWMTDRLGNIRTCEVCGKQYPLLI